MCQVQDEAAFEKSASWLPLQMYPSFTHKPVCGLLMLNVQVGRANQACSSWCVNQAVTCRRSDITGSCTTARKCLTGAAYRRAPTPLQLSIACCFAAACTLPARAVYSVQHRSVLQQLGCVPAAAMATHGCDRLGCE
jgi:hypothetical protein